MPQNFISADVDQSFLMAPDVREWLPEDVLAWCVRDVVAQLDLGPFTVLIGRMVMAGRRSIRL